MSSNDAAHAYVQEHIDAAGHPGWKWTDDDIAAAFMAGDAWRIRAFMDVLDRWEDHAIRGMANGATAYHQGKVSLITDLRDWMREDGRDVRMRPSSDELLPNLATTEQWRRLVASGLPPVTYSLAVLWNIVHGMDCIYEFDNTMAADELIEELVSIIELEACAKKQKTES